MTVASLDPRPGVDEVTVIAAKGRHDCAGLELCRVGKPAEVIVFFGRLGTGPGDALWPAVWGKSLPMCGGCWDITRTVATARRPQLVIWDRRVPAPRSGGDAR
jgi:hypothetical protein